jgi:hypothetical protein
MNLAIDECNLMDGLKPNHYANKTTTSAEYLFTCQFLLQRTMGSFVRKHA